MTEYRWKLLENPIIAVAVLIILNTFFVLTPLILSWFVTGIFDTLTGLAFRFAVRLILWFMIVPFVLHLPNGKEPFKGFLRSISLTSFSPRGRLALITVVGALLNLGGIFLAALLYGGWTLDLSLIVNPTNPSIIYSINPGLWEEIGWRGLILTLLLKRFSLKRAVVLNSVLFSLSHLINLLAGRPLLEMLGQLIFVFMGSLFLALLFIRTESLIPCIIIHYAVDAFSPLFMASLLSGPDILVGGVYFLVGAAIGIMTAIAFLLWLTKDMANAE
ncbi:MAG: lysostaphin resistance A-like protein [Promethearchaeota archaeon]